MFACHLICWCLLSLLVFGLQGSQGPAIDCCPDGWVAMRDGKTCYRIIINETEVVFEDNKALCELLGASMLMIKSEEDNDILNSEVDDIQGWNYWLGAEYVAGGNGSSFDPLSYRWLDGTPFNYTKWGSGQPRLRSKGDCNRITWTRHASDETYWQNNQCQGGRQLCLQTSDQFFEFYLAKELPDSLSTPKPVAPAVPVDMISDVSQFVTDSRDNVPHVTTETSQKPMNIITETLSAVVDNKTEANVKVEVEDNVGDKELPPTYKFGSVLTAYWLELVMFGGMCCLLCCTCFLCILCLRKRKLERRCQCRMDSPYKYRPTDLY